MVMKKNCFRSNSFFRCPLQSGSEYRTHPVFEWSKQVWFSNSLVFEYKYKMSANRLNTGPHSVLNVYGIHVTDEVVELRIGLNVQFPVYTCTLHITLTLIQYIKF